MGLLRLLTPGILTAALLCTGGCGETSEPAPPEQSATTVYRHAMDGAPSSLDPAQASNLYAKILTVNLYDTLYRYRYLARPYELEPNLAEELPQVSTDGLI